MALAQGFFVSGVSLLGSGTQSSEELGVLRALGLVEMMHCKVLRNVPSVEAIVSKKTDKYLVEPAIYLPTEL